MKKYTVLILLGIIVLAGFLRVWRLDQHDVVTDEVFYGYRSIALIDSLNSPYQSTPFEWFEDIPWWAHVSFHDHPPLGFWVQHLFFKVFGNDLLAMRLPFALAGVASVLLIYFIAKRLFASEKVGLGAALLLAVSNYHVWISRIGLQESLVIFLLLLCVHLFLKSLENDRYFYWTAAALGLAVLMKYTSIVAVPIFLLYLYSRRRELLTWKKLLIAAGLFLVIISPVIIYNIGLYSARGHFDFQLSYFLKQNVPEWEVRPGREIGGLGDKLSNLFRNFWNYAGPVAFVGMFVSVLAAGFRRKEQGYFFSGIVFLLFFLLFLAVGPQERFLAMLVPFWAVVISALLFQWRNQRFGYIFFCLVLFLELGISVNTNLKVNPLGEQGREYTFLRRESNIWGYNQLEDFFLSETAGKYPKFSFPLKFSFTDALQQEALQRARERGLTENHTLFVADSRIHGPAYLWYFTRYTVYERWPIIEDKNFLAATAADPDFFAKQGFERVVYFQAGDTLLRPDSDNLGFEGMEKETGLSVLPPKFVTSPNGKIAFRVYEWPLMETEGE